MKIAFIVLLLIALSVFVPFAVIWSLNTLFSLGIAYTFATWLATFVLLVAVSGTRSSSR